MNRPDPSIEAYVTIETPLGLMALGERGGRLRGVVLPSPAQGRHPEALIAQAWPSADPDASVLPDLVRQVRAYWRGQVAEFDAELDLTGFSPFYARVWRAAMRIPPGQVRTYGRLAADVGSPRAARAVGGAMAHNPFGLIVPCHRVVASSGSLCGFSAEGGLRLKQALLDWERDHLPAVEEPAVPKAWPGRGCRARHGDVLGRARS